MASRQRYSRRLFVGRLNAMLHKMDSNHDIEAMDVMEVLFALCKHDGLTTVGSPREGFAYICPLTNKLQVLVRSSEQVTISVDASETMKAARVAVCTRGAEFISVGDIVVCKVGGVQAWGVSEGEAALRAFAKLELSTEED